MPDSIAPINANWLVKSWDTNQDQKMNELKVHELVKNQIDQDNNGEVSQQELVHALNTDQVEVRHGEIVESSKEKVFVHGLETQQNIHKSTSDVLKRFHVKAPAISNVVDGIGMLLSSGEDAKAAENRRKSRLRRSNREYATANSTMFRTLKSVRDMTKGATDAQSKVIHQLADQTLSSASFNSWFAAANELSDFLLGGSFGLQTTNSNLQAAYIKLRATLTSINEQTKDLPDLPKAIQATDSSLAQAFSNIEALQNKAQSPQEVSQNLLSEAENQKQQATGRAGNYSLIGAGIGAVGGGLVGFFAGGKSIKSAAIGIGAGTAAAAGIGAIIGHSTDQKFIGKSETLISLAQQVSNYNPEADLKELQTQNQKAYEQFVIARSTHEMDPARVVTNELKGVQSKVNPIVGNSQRILEAYDKALSVNEE